MRILINDFGGYAFIAQLARQLALLDTEVHHCYCASLTTTPHGNVAKDDVAGCQIHPIQLTAPLQKYSFVKRRAQEVEYGKRAADLVQRIRPDIVVSANTPLDALRSIWRAATRTKSRKVFWLQDIIGEAAHRILSKKLPLIGKLIGGHYIRLEKSLLRASDLVLPISSAFSGYLDQAGVRSEQVKVFENWAPIEDIPLLEKDNSWSREHRLNERFVVLYSGTLSMKHDPALILQVAKALEPTGGLMVVRSQGLGADWLKEQNTSGSYPSLRIDGYVPYQDLPSSLASADVLLAVLEPDAAKYSVPSKVLTYLSAGRAVLLVSPQENLAAQKVLASAGGVVISDTRTGTLVNAVQDLAGNLVKTKQFGSNGRRYAEKEFNIASIRDRFFQTINAC